VADNPANQKVYGPVVKRHLDYWDIEIELVNVSLGSGYWLLQLLIALDEEL
jgi:hypothetical protein